MWYWCMNRKTMEQNKVHGKRSTDMTLVYEWCEIINWWRGGQFLGQLSILMNKNTIRSSSQIIHKNSAELSQNIKF